ncbi:unnamed protein product, partial [Mesorhabditis belari]|uniref:Multifunctional fusion protein n=1 Tax=Mesorhabditis belari TaxID=2138241 RepID=A0AAF3FEL0_9BILA
MDEDHYDTPWEFLVRPGSIRLSTAGMRLPGSSSPRGCDSSSSPSSPLPPQTSPSRLSNGNSPPNTQNHHVHQLTQQQFSPEHERNKRRTNEKRISLRVEKDKIQIDFRHDEDLMLEKGIDRIEAEKRLESTNLGDYLLRYRKEGSAALSLKGSTSVLHIKLERRDGQWIVGEGPTFRSISSAIQYYRRHPLPIRGAEHVLLNRNFSKTGGETRFDQKWELPDRKLVSTWDELMEIGDFILLGNFSYSKGLGNLMFQYAAMIALAQKYQALLPISEENLLRRAFDLQAIDCCTYKDLSLNFSWAQNLRKVEGYMQNWRWFYPGETVKLIREEFQFLPTIQQMSNDLIEEAKARWRLGRAERESGKDQMEIDYRLKFADEITDPIIVGIHVRRGLDLTFHYRNMKHGHKAAPRDYYEKTIQYFREKFQQLIFLISSDDLKWAKENLQETKPGEFFFLPRNTEREVGMSVLSSCDHLIISTGTFSWWAAFLADDEKNEAISSCAPPKTSTAGLIGDVGSESRQGAKNQTFRRQATSGRQILHRKVHVRLNSHDDYIPYQTKGEHLEKTAIGRQPWELNHVDIECTKKLGEGAFGEVHKGKLKLKAKLEVLTKEQIKEIMREARLMRNFDNPNVVKFY